jgi:hypothetical protein
MTSSIFSKKLSRGKTWFAYEKHKIQDILNQIIDLIHYESIKETST